LFLVEWLGGPSVYSPVHGHPRLRMRHAKVQVDVPMRDAWLRCMAHAMDDLAVIGDVRVLWSGALRGGPRLARHLWRMCFALFIAAGSFFSIRARVAKVLPEPFTTPAMRALPVLLVFLAMFYWLWRVRRRGLRLLH